MIIIWDMAKEPLSSKRVKLSLFIMQKYEKKFVVRIKLIQSSYIWLN